MASPSGSVPPQTPQREREPIETRSMRASDDSPLLSWPSLAIHRERQQDVARYSVGCVSRIHEEHPAGDGGTRAIQRATPRRNLVHGLVRADRIEVPKDGPITSGERTEMPVDRPGKGHARNGTDRGRLSGTAPGPVIARWRRRVPDSLAGIEAESEHAAADLRIGFGGRAVRDIDPSDIRERHVDI